MGDSYNDKNANSNPQYFTNKKKMNAQERPQKRHKARQKLGEIIQNNDWNNIDDERYDELYDARNY